MFLIFNIFPYYGGGNFISYASDKVTIIPQFPSPKLFSERRKLLKYLPCRYTLHYLYQSCRRIFRWGLNKYVNMVFYHFHRIYLKTILFTYLFKHFLQKARDLPSQHFFSIFRYPYQVILQIVNRMLGPFYTHATFITVTVSLVQTLIPDSPYGEPLSSPQQS
jgi:hypothetical protein